MKSMARSLQWTKLIAVMIVTLVCALSVHAFMLDWLNIPFPDSPIDAKVSRYVSKTIGFLALIMFLKMTVDGEDAQFFRRLAIAFLVYGSLNEFLVRGPFMQGYCSNAWLYAFAQNLPYLVPRLLAAALVALVTPRLDRVWKCVLAAAAITAIFQFEFIHWSASALKGSSDFLSAYAPTNEWCTHPYGLKVLIPAYLTFIEPVLGCTAAIILCWDRLPGSDGQRVAAFTLLIVALKNQLLEPFIYMFHAKPPALLALASEGQFALEAVALGVLTGMGWIWMGRTRPTAPVV